jgi:2-amino-4-hydroxy-6-hydroxymethyldihydropteridine diphosphokinase
LSVPTLRAVIGFGANLGERVETIRAAARELGLVARIEKTSRIFETSPVGGPPQPDFLNAAALVTFEGEPDSLLRALLAIEAKLGRRRTAERYGPRTIDLDILWIDGICVETESLQVPHPRLTERAFALIPLLEVAPLARDPRTGKALADSPLAQNAGASQKERITPSVLKWGAAFTSTSILT